MILIKLLPVVMLAGRVTADIKYYKGTGATVASFIETTSEYMSEYTSYTAYRTLYGM